MKKILLVSMMLMAMLNVAMAQQKDGAEIKFEKLTHDFGEFPETKPVQECTFTFTNVGNAPLVINQVMAGCGCTTPTYTKEPIMPGKKGVITVKYNGEGKFPGHFKKAITVRTNGVPELVRLYIEGVMTETK